MLQDILVKLENAERLLNKGDNQSAKENLAYAIGQLEMYLLSKSKADSTSQIEKFLEKHAPSIWIQAKALEKREAEDGRN